MRIQQSNIHETYSVAEWSANSQEAIINDSQHGAEFFCSRIQDLHAQKLQHMLSVPSPSPSIAGTTPPISRQNSEVFVVFKKPGLFASLKTKLAKLFCLASPEHR